MSKILTLAKDFEAKSKQQANATEQHLKSVFKQHEQFIENALRKSEQKIEKNIRERTQNMNRLVLKSWGWILLSICLVLAVSFGIAWWQGQQIQQNWVQIREQNQTLKQLQQKTWGVQLVADKDGQFIRLPAGYKGVTGWTIKDGKIDLIKLEKK